MATEPSLSDLRRICLKWINDNSIHNPFPGVRGLIDIYRAIHYPPSPYMNIELKKVVTPKQPCMLYCG